MEGRKDKLIAGDPSKWGIDYTKLQIPKEEILGNKGIARALVLKDDSLVLDEMQEMLGYFNNLLWTEAQNFRDYSGCRNSKSFVQFAKRQMEIYSGVSREVTRTS